MAKKANRASKASAGRDKSQSKRRKAKAAANPVGDFLKGLAKVLASYFVGSPFKESYAVLLKYDTGISTYPQRVAVRLGGAVHFLNLTGSDVELNPSIFSPGDADVDPGKVVVPAWMKGQKATRIAIREDAAVGAHAPVVTPSLHEVTPSVPEKDDPCDPRLKKFAASDPEIIIVP